MVIHATFAPDPNQVIAPVGRRLFGSFVEHMGRCVYGGIFEPDHPSADEFGLRSDVLELVRELGVSIVRYPGGNFVSGYRWEDGVGPVDERPVRLDTAWRSVEPNTFGLAEFIRWTEAARAAPMLALNLGTRGIQEALDLLEYSNHPGGTWLSDLRKANGRNEPFGIRTWCLGNEMDGPWQLGHKTADEYGRLATETARAMRMIDPDLELVLCGSSGSSMPTFGDWERTVLEHAFDQVDLISAHAYYEESEGDRFSFLCSAADMDRTITEVTSIADRVAAAKSSTKRLGIAFDEWNVWYLSRHAAIAQTEQWRRAPRLCEDPYTVIDAVVVGSLLMTLLRHSDRVGIACLAQLVNTIAPIQAEADLPAWRKTTFYPFALTSHHAQGNVLGAAPSGPVGESRKFGEVSLVDAVAVHNPETEDLTIFAINRAEAEAVLSLDLRALVDLEVIEVMAVFDDDLEAFNGPLTQTRVVPKRLEWVSGDQGIEILLPSISWTMIRVGRGVLRESAGS